MHLITEFIFRVKVIEKPTIIVTDSSMLLLVAHKRADRKSVRI
jgi:hypothetical protein